MAQSNLAYKQEALEQGFDARPIPAPRPELRTIQGQGRGVQTQQAPWVHTLVVMSAIVLVVLASVSIARVSISNATVHMMQTAEQTNFAIESARGAGLELEVQHSLANNPTRIQDRAASLGILPASQPETIPALAGFSTETLEQMNTASSEHQAAELSALKGQKSEATSLKLLPVDTADETTGSGASIAPNAQSEGGLEATSSEA